MSGRAGAGRREARFVDLHYRQSFSMKPLFVTCDRREAEKHQSDKKKKTNLIYRISIAETRNAIQKCSVLTPHAVS